MDSSFQFAFPADRVHPKIRLQQKLHPQRFPQMPTVMGAVVSYLVDAEFVDPQIQEITVTTDGTVLARVNHEPNFNRYIGEYSDLMRHWFGLLSVAGLTPEERAYADAIFAERIGFYGPSQA
ncbi:MAG TPA: hypothetical protein VL155_18365 [Terriglobales bacterium]|nr:hypothetical protein [Terriglobales bacterium]